MFTSTQKWYGIAACNAPLAVHDWVGGDVPKVDQKRLMRRWLQQIWSLGNEAKVLLGRFRVTFDAAD